MDGSEIGLFGTLRLMKRKTDEQVAAFPIDEETVTFGRDPTCSVRLYYPEISALHAKIVFQERKAFLVVLGAAGLTIDGCPVLPSTNASLPTTIPVSNNCEIEIHKKRFVFLYPPKQLRSPLYNIDSPVKPENGGSGGRRKLRMSMIHSAQVFTPRGKPSSDPLANLRILQSPLKQLVPSPRKPSALKHSHIPEPDEIEEEIVLVESNAPHVVQEDKDLVILERVDVQAPPPPTPPVQRPIPSMNIYKTPNRRTRPSLHRAVLIRSVHRAVMAREEEEEEKEVEEVIVSAAEEGENGNNEEFNDEYEGSAGNEHGEFDGDGDDADSDTIGEPTPQPSTWRKSLDAVRARVVWPFRSSSTAPEENDDDKQDEHEDEDDEMDTDQDAQAPPPSSSPPSTYIIPQAQPHLTPARAPRPLGSFMTPQVSHPQSGIGIGIGRGAGRNSFGGALRVPLPPGVSAVTPSGPVETWGGAKRVRVEPKWRIGDIEVQGAEVKEEEKAGSGLGRTRVSEEEKKAIQERRKSALTTPDPFFAQVPGLRRQSVAPSTPSAPSDGNMLRKLPSLLDSAIRTVGERSASPTKSGERSASPTKFGERSTSPTKFGERSASPTKDSTHSRPSSPMKVFHSPVKSFEGPVKAYTPFGRPPSPLKAPLTPHSEEDEEDTRSLLDRMKRTVEEMKRRRSVGPSDEREYEEDGEDEDAAGAEQRMDVEENTEEDIGEEQQTGEEEENSDKENGLASSLREPQFTSHAEPDLETTDPSEHMSAPLSPTRIALDLDLELERTPLPQLTRSTSRPPHKNPPLFSGPQTPALASLKHLFPPPAPVPNTPAVKSMRSLFRGAGKGAGMEMEQDVLEGVGEMMVTPEGYRARAEDVNEREGEMEGEEQANKRETEERRKPARTITRKTPVTVPASGPGPATTLARRRTRTTTATGAITSKGREPSTSRTVSRVETMVTKRVPIPLPKRTEKEKETAKMPEAALEPEPEDEAEEEIQEIPPQPAAQKKPARARLLRARKGVAADNLDEEPAAPRAQDASTEPRMRAASTEPRARVATTTTASKTKIDVVEMVPKTRAARGRATPVPVARSEPAKARPRVPAKPKVATTTTRAPSRSKIRNTEDDDDADGDDPLDSIAQPEAPAPIQRARRTRAVTAPVKEEDADVPIPGKAKSTTTTRRRAVTAVDKENTPSSSKEDEGERKKEVEVKRTTRATRSRA